MDEETHLLWWALELCDAGRESSQPCVGGITSKKYQLKPNFCCLWLVSAATAHLPRPCSQSTAWQELTETYKTNAHRSDVSISPISSVTVFNMRSLINRVNQKCRTNSKVRWSPEWCIFKIWVVVYSSVLTFPGILCSGKTHLSQCCVLSPAILSAPAPRSGSVKPQIPTRSAALANLVAMQLLWWKDQAVISQEVEIN